MDIRNLPLHDLVLDPNLNLRDRLDQDTVDRYVDAWERLPPVVVYEIDGDYFLADGVHRHAAAVVLGKRTVPAEVRSGTFAEALDFVAGANLFHGLPLTRAERRRAIEVKLRLHHEWSDRRLAEELAVGRELVAKMRRQLVEAGQVPALDTRVGSDGKAYPAVHAYGKDPNERLPTGPALAQQDDPRDRGDREADAAPWEDAPSAGAKGGPSRVGGDDAWAAGVDAKTVATAPLAPSAAPTIDEMLAMMTRQIIEVIQWTQAEGFVDSYRTAGANARGLFQTAAIKLAARADQLRRA